jgi:hypothetical protein
MPQKSPRLIAQLDMEDSRQVNRENGGPHASHCSWRLERMFTRFVGTDSDTMQLFFFMVILLLEFVVGFTFLSAHLGRCRFWSKVDRLDYM